MQDQISHLPQRYCSELKVLIECFLLQGTLPPKPVTPTHVVPVPKSFQDIQVVSRAVIHFPQLCLIWPNGLPTPMHVRTSSSILQHQCVCICIHLLHYVLYRITYWHEKKRLQVLTLAETNVFTVQLNVLQLIGEPHPWVLMAVLDKMIKALGGQTENALERKHTLDNNTTTLLACTSPFVPK